MIKRLIAVVGAFLIGGSLSSPLPAEEDSSQEIPFLTMTRTAVPLSQLPTNLSVLTETDIAESGAKTIDEVLEQLPSVNLSRSGSLGTFATVRIRGVPSSSQVKIIVDDQPVSGVSADQNFDLSQMAVEDIERVEVVRGGSSVLYGANSVGGVIHIITKKQTGRGPEMDIGLEGRSHQTKIVRGNAGCRWGRTDLFVTASAYETGGYQQNQDGQDITTSATVGYSWRNAARLSSRLSHVDHEVGNPQGTTVDIAEWDGRKERAASNLTRRNETARTDGRLRFDLPVGGGHFQSTGFFSNASLLAHGGDSPFDALFERDVLLVGNDSRLVFPRGLTIGTSYERDEMKTNTLSLEHVTNVGLYLQENLAFSRWELLPAARLDHHGNFGTEINPRLTVLFRISKAWDLTGNVARSIRAPSFFDLFGDFPPTFKANRDLEPEVAWTYDLGNRMRFGSTVEIQISGYFTRMRNRIAGVDRDGDFINETNGNVSRAELSGLEAELTCQWGRWRGSANTSFQRARGTTATSSQFQALPLTPRQMANAKLVWETEGGFSLSNTIQYVSRQYQASNEQGLILPAYGLWHIRLAQKFPHGGTLVLGVNNATDRRYADSFDFATPIGPFGTATRNPQPGRTFFANVDVQWGRH